MTSEKRREREKEEMKELILSAAADIVAVEGFDKLSIRKIAAKIEYSPAIIYHYFTDKDEIMNHLLQTGYRKILTSVSAAATTEEAAINKLRSTMRNYINTALNMSEEFVAVHMNDNKNALAHTSSLYQGATDHNPALKVLLQYIKQVNIDAGIVIGVEDTEKLEMTTQLIVVSTIGFIIKLIVEKNTTEEQQNRLIEYYCNEMVPKMAKIK